MSLLVKEMEALIKNKISQSAQRVFQYVLDDLRERLPAHTTYHNLRHTLDVVECCNNYVEVYDLDEEDHEHLLIAAVAHDYGFVFSPDNHEATSANMVAKIMLKHDYNLDSISKVRGLIMATKLPQSPKNFLEEIIADADLDYLGRRDYPEISLTFYKELSHYGKLENQRQWYDLQIGFLENHTYFTAWAQENRQPGKFETLRSLKNQRAAL